MKTRVKRGYRKGFTRGATPVKQTIPEQVLAMWGTPIERPKKLTGENHDYQLNQR